MRKISDKFNFTGKELFKNILTLLSIALIYFILCFVNFAKGTFDFSKVYDTTFWAIYFLTIGLGISAMFLAIPYKKDKLKALVHITDMEHILRSLKNYIDTSGIEGEFTDYLAGRNRERKLQKYKEHLQYKKQKAKKTADIERYSKLLETAQADIENIRLRIKPITVNTIFSGLKEKNESGNVFYSGTEGLATKIIPAIIGGMCITVITMILSIDQMETTQDKIIQLASKLWVITSYILKGLSFAKHSINTVYYSVLENRKGEVLAFLTKRGTPVVVEENEFYKYKVVENGKKVGE